MQIRKDLHTVVGASRRVDVSHGSFPDGGGAALAKKERGDRHSIREPAMWRDSREEKRPVRRS